MAKKTSLHKVMVVVFVCLNHLSAVAPPQYCSYEHFNATCPTHEYILIKTARYGRMRIGRCVKNNLGYLGCAADVLPTMDRKCSGMHHCSVSVGDQELRSAKPCPHDVTWYLEVVYECVPVFHSKENTTCSSRGSRSALNSTGYIGSLVTMETGYGSSNCPWVLRARQGQQLLISVVNLSFRSTSAMDVCYELGSVVEGHKRSPVTICGRDLSRRIIQVYASSGSQVALAVSGVSNTQQFFFRYDVIGCPEVKLTESMAGKRVSDRFIVTCNNSEETWVLVCERNRWVGYMGNCTGSLAARWAIGNLFQDGSVLPMGILIAVALGVALGIFLGGILLVVVGSRMKRRQRQRLARASYIEAPGYEVSAEKAQLGSHISDRSTMPSSDYISASYRTDLSSLQDTDRIVPCSRISGHSGTLDSRSVLHTYETPNVS